MRGGLAKENTMSETFEPTTTEPTRRLTPELAALDHDDMAFPRGTITALIGPTGSGKSTFLRTLNRMNDKVYGFRRDGEVLLDDCSIWDSSQDLLTVRRRVGMLFQRPNPFPMSIKDNVIAGVRAHRIAKGKQLDVIAETRLREVG